jgi:gas vesicle protein
MAEEPDRLKQDIENTRATLTRDVDLLAEKTSPRQVARRRWTSVKEKVMGTTEDTRYAVQDKASNLAGTAGEKASHLSDKAGETASNIGDKASSAAHTAADAVRSAPQTVAGQTQGNPLAAGIIAFGVGLLASSLIPVTDAERRAGQQLKEHGSDLTDQVKDVAGEMKDDLTGTVQQAAGQVKQVAQEGVQETKEQARSSAQDAKEQTRQAAQA